MTPETAAAVMAERESIAAICDLREEMWLKDSVSYQDGRFNMAEGAGRIAAAIRARPAPVVEPAGDGVMQALRSIETIASRDGDTFRDFMRPTERMEQILRTARAALADLQRAEG